MTSTTWARLVEPPHAGGRTFLDWPLAIDLARLEADVAVLGIPFGVPYRSDQPTNDQIDAPEAVRAQSGQFSDGPDHHDFDVGGPLLDGRAVTCVDCGDVTDDVDDASAHYRNAERAVRAILGAGALPLVIGGDHGVTIPALRAYRDHGPVFVVHVDAHLDWRDEVNGVREGYSSPLRRASEMPWVSGMVQIGMRGTGSARQAEVDAARAYGSAIVPAIDVLDGGIAVALAHIPAGARYYVTIDADGLDPSVMPGVMAPVPGGLLFHHVRGLLHALVARGRVVGMDVVEIAPSRDVNGISAITAGRLLLNLVGAMVRAGQLGG
ncbi:MAG: agmatinase [Ectothiorhodospiraceae bacterium]|nr:agmatinase [Chromatiales bacterium]MCP5154326.1 agmatinase [Ectothiorhodospiraceae bacterium]